MWIENNCTKSSTSIIIAVVKKTLRYSNVFSYNHLYQPECFYEKRYKWKYQILDQDIKVKFYVREVQRFGVQGSKAEPF